MDISEIDTPALIIDLDALEANIEKMGRFCHENDCNLRPHIKVHKTPAIAHKQIQAGAIGVTCAKLGEAEVMAFSGIRQILIANQIVGPIKLQRLAGVTRHADVSVAFDDPQVAEAASREALRQDTTIGAAIEVDIGMGRGGLQPGADVVALAKKITKLEGLEFKGIMGYEGHLQQIDKMADRVPQVTASLKLLTSTAKMLKENGIATEFVSCGGTNTYNISATFEGITEIQAGSYVFMDVEHDIEGLDFQHSLSVMSTVTSRGGEHRALIDAGIKCFGAEPIFPRSVRKGIEVVSLSEEHGWLKTDGSAPAVGERLQFYPYYSPTAVNLYDKFYCVRKGRVEVQWDILGRGKSQ
ncbi:MAG: DSD1 family PLP-dependent enzyme [Thaumarchaeota archaeon]|nr:DSD1 family PLP-dependent enzyme [Nitrososphaerota archaeon]